MTSTLVLNLFVLITLAVAAAVSARPRNGRDGPFWTALVLAAAAAVTWAWELLSGGWHAEFGTMLWVIVGGTSVLFLPLAAFVRPAWRLAPLLMPYLTVLGLLASVVRGEPVPLNDAAPAVWLDLHIAGSVAVFALLTLAAVAFLAVALQERALKKKRPTAWTAALPSVAEGERLAGGLLMVSEAVLGLGLATGMAVQYFQSGSLLRFDHKILFSLTAFAMIGALLLGHQVCGVRGRIAARVVLTAYLLIILASPGVKFVTQVLL